MCFHLRYKNENQIEYVNQVNQIRPISIINKIHSAGTNQRLLQLGILNSPLKCLSPRQAFTNKSMLACMCL